MEKKVEKKVVEVYRDNAKYLVRRRTAEVVVFRHDLLGNLGGKDCYEVIGTEVARFDDLTIDESAQLVSEARTY